MLVAELGDERGDALPDRAAARQRLVLEVGGAGVGGADEDEQAGAVGAAAAAKERSVSRPSRG